MPQSTRKNKPAPAAPANPALEAAVEEYKKAQKNLQTNYESKSTLMTQLQENEVSYAIVFV